MPGKGFLIRGTLSPSFGGSTIKGPSPVPVNRIATPVPVRKGKISQGPATVQHNRIPSSISIKKNNGVR